MSKIISKIPGIIFSVGLAFICVVIASFIPKGLISAGVFALLIGMMLNPFTKKIAWLKDGFVFTSKTLLKTAIVLMGFSLSFSQIIKVGGFSLIVMTVTLITAFAGGFLLGKLLKMDWKLSGLISAGTGICGGSAIAAISPVIKAKDSDIAYAISATFIFDIIMVVLFPIMGKALNMSDMGFGLWAGTAVNDTSSVVAAGYAFSDLAGNYSIIVKLTRTLSIVPVVLIFSLVNTRIEKKQLIASGQDSDNIVRQKANIGKIFPYFILFFLLAIGIKSTGFIPENVTTTFAEISKFFMVMALGAIGLKTDIREFKSNGFKPMLHGFLISLLVVVMSLLVQIVLRML